LLKRPSSRRKSNAEQIQLNLVPILDTMVTLIGFLLFTGSFLALVSIESPFPQTSPETVREKIREKPLQLTVTLHPKEAEIWSPFDKISPKKITHEAEGQPDLRGIHSALVQIKTQFPAETKVVIVPEAGTSYDVLISLMDTLRMMDPTDPPLFARNEKTGNDEPVKTLFPDVIFGNLLGDR